MLVTVLVFILILSVLVLIHELGHFLVARKFGIKVEEFGFGFPPRIWGIKRGETLYSINALPIGGFVKLYGEDDAGGGKITKEDKNSKITGKDLERAYFSKPIWQRALVVLAGVTMNFILAVIIATYLFTFEGIPTQSNQVQIGAIVKDSPAEKAGLKVGDTILKINNKDISSSELLIAETRNNLGKEELILIERDGKEYEIKATPRKDYPKDQGPLGVSIGNKVDLIKYPFPQSIYYGLKQSVLDSYQVVIGFKEVLVTIATKFTVPEGVAGPVGMAQLTGEFVKVGPGAVLALMYMLSLSLAVLNVLPIPALDGGRLLFIIIEAITRRKVNPKYEAYAHMVGIVLLLSFLAFVSYKDILRIISGQSILPQ